ncbi:hypothetical protein D3C84_770230 [compost metagenome]
MEFGLHVEHIAGARKLQDHVIGVVDPHRQDLARHDEFAALEEWVSDRLVPFIETRQFRTGHALHRIDHRQLVQCRLPASQGHQVVLLHDVTEEVQRTRVDVGTVGGILAR